MAYDFDDVRSGGDVREVRLPLLQLLSQPVGQTDRQGVRQTGSQTDRESDRQVPVLDYLPDLTPKNTVSNARNCQMTFVKMMYTLIC